MFIKLNTYTLYVNFNKHKREYIVIPIIHMGRGLLKTKQRTNLYITLLPEILMQKIFKQNGM